MKKPRIRQFVSDGVSFDIVQMMGQLLPEWFGNESWNGWRCVLKAAYALPMSSEEIAFFRSIAGDRDPPRKRVRELWVIAGRRQGQNRVVDRDLRRE